MHILLLLEPDIIKEEMKPPVLAQFRQTRSLSVINLLDPTRRILQLALQINLRPFWYNGVREEDEEGS